MKQIKRLSVATLVFVMVLSTLLVIPVSAYRIGDEHYESGQCSCGVDLEGLFGVLIDSTDKGQTRAVTHIYHDTPNCSSASTYVSAKFWHYPSASSSAYNATIRTKTEYGRYSEAVVAAKENGIVMISGEIFCIESNHRIATVCRGTTYTYSKYLCTGEPALK